MIRLLIFLINYKLYRLINNYFSFKSYNSNQIDEDSKIINESFKTIEFNKKHLKSKNNMYLQLSSTMNPVDRLISKYY